MSATTQQEGRITVISAASGTGKTSIIWELKQRYPDLGFSVSFTTRPRREGEVYGKDYYFVSEGEFDAMLERGEFLEFATVHGRRYGTSIKQVLDLVDQGVNVILDIDVQGHGLLRHFNFGERTPPLIHSIFILPPDMRTLRNRLLNRLGGADNIDRRLTAAEGEIGRMLEYDSFVVNHTGGLGETVENVWEMMCEFDPSEN